jgi:hypothetical protein
MNKPQFPRNAYNFRIVRYEWKELDREPIISYVPQRRRLFVWLFPFWYDLIDEYTRLKTEQEAQGWIAKYVREKQPKSPEDVYRRKPEVVYTLSVPK